MADEQKFPSLSRAGLDRWGTRRRRKKMNTVANVGNAMWTQLRSINIGEPQAIVALTAVGVGDTHLFRHGARDPRTGHALGLTGARHGHRQQIDVTSGRPVQQGIGV